VHVTIPEALTGAAVGLTVSCWAMLLYDCGRRRNSNSRSRIIGQETLSRVTTLQHKTKQYHQHSPAVLFPLCDACISCFAPPPMLLLAVASWLSVDCCLLCSVFPPSPVCWSGRCHCLLHGCRQLFLPPLPQNAFCHRAKQRCSSSYHNSSIQLLILRDRNTCGCCAAMIR